MRGNTELVRRRRTNLRVIGNARTCNTLCELREKKNVLRNDNFEKIVR